MQHHHPQGHRQQRVHVVPERRLDHVAVVDGPDVEQPVARDQDAGDRQAGHLAVVGQHRSQPAPRPPPGEHKEDDDERPQDAVQQDLDRTDGLEAVEHQREQAPQ